MPRRNYPHISFAIGYLDPDFGMRSTGQAGTRLTVPASTSKDADLPWSVSLIRLRAMDRVLSSAAIWARIDQSLLIGQRSSMATAEHIEGNIALVFPGQGSQFVGMGKELQAASPAAFA